MRLVFGGRFESGIETLDRGILDLFFAQTGEGLTLYALGGANGGVVSYTLTTGGLSVLDADYYSSGTLVDPIAPALMTLGADLLVYGAADSGDLVGLNLSSAGQTASLHLPSDGVAGPQSAILTTTLGNGQTALYAIDQARGGLHLYLQNGTGWTTSGGTYAFQSDGPDAGRALLDSLRIGSTEFLLAATSFSDTVTAFRISGTNGTLTQTGSLGRDEGLGINTPTAMETFTAFGAGWVILAASDSNSLSVMRLGADGSLTPTDHLLDTLHTRFEGLSAMTSVVVGDRVFLIAGGADDGISLFTLLPDGRLVHLQTLVDDSGIGLGNVQSLEAAVVGDCIQIYVASGAVGGLSLFTLDLVEQGVNRRASGLVAGTSGDDLLVATGSNDTLQGGAGDDILASGTGRTAMTGGAGGDLFVLRPSGQRQLITDFIPGADRLDLSNWPFLRNIGQLEVATSGSSLILGFNGNSVEIRSGTGRALTLADVFPGLTLGTPDHMPLTNLDDWVVPDAPLGPTPAPLSIAIPVAVSEPGISAASAGNLPTDLTGFRQLSGSAGSDLIFGSIGDDSIWGGAGDDEMGGGSGNDLIYGATGRDTLWGAAGNDTLFGGSENDQIGASHGNDSLYGETGDDVLWSSAGNDLAVGGLGNDEAWGGSGDDTVSGGDGNDLIGGGADNDYVMGGAGHDTIWGGTGNDTIWGGEDDDQIGGGAGGDHIESGEGNDTVWGAAGNDTILGGTGQDQIWAANGDDVVAGGEGNDTLGGGAGADTLLGDAGNDLLLGGANADVFVFSGTFGSDSIGDFEVGLDRLAFDAPYASTDDLALSASGTSTIIRTVDGAITLSGITPDSLTTDSFVFGWDSL